MKVEIRDREALSSLSLPSLRTYLKSRGWVNEGEWGGRATIFSTVNDGQKWEVLCPHRDTVADYAECMAENVAVLSAVEDRSQLDVYFDLVSARADVIHLRSPNGLAEEKLSLRQNTEMFSAAQDLLAAAARSVEKPSAVFRGRISNKVVDYLNSIQPARGYHEGFSLTLHSPVPAGFGTPLDFGDAFTAPFPRLATSRLSLALNRTTNAISESVSKDSLEPFSLGVGEGVSANLCDSLAVLTKKGKGIKIGLYWADVRPTNHPNGDFQFTENSAEILTEAANFLRHNDPSFGEYIIAQVVLLQREPKEFDGRAILLSLWDERLIRISVEFEESDYNLVIDAFKNQKFVGLSGDIHPVSRGYELRHPKNLSLVGHDT